MSGTMANGTVRSNLSAWHIIAAAQFARNAGELESSYAGKPFDDFYQDIASCVMASIFFSVAALEAGINELFTDASITIAEQTESLTREIWTQYEAKTSVLDKYNLALMLKNNEKLDKGNAGFQNAELLIRLRNALVHSKPEWSHENGKHKNIEKQLAGKFATSPFMTSGDVFFPKQCMSHACAEWAVRSARNFMSIFCSTAHLEDRFEPFSRQLSTR